MITVYYSSIQAKLMLTLLGNTCTLPSLIAQLTLSSLSPSLSTHNRSSSVNFFLGRRTNKGTIIPSLWRGALPIKHQIDLLILSQTLTLSVLCLTEEELIQLEMEVSEGASSEGRAACTALEILTYLCCGLYACKYALMLTTAPLFIFAIPLLVCQIS